MIMLYASTPIHNSLIYICRAPGSVLDNLCSCANLMVQTSPKVLPRRYPQIADRFNDDRPSVMGIEADAYLAQVYHLGSLGQDAVHVTGGWDGEWESGNMAVAVVVHRCLPSDRY